MNLLTGATVLWFITTFRYDIIIKQQLVLEGYAIHCNYNLFSTSALHLEKEEKQRDSSGNKNIVTGLDSSLKSTHIHTHIHIKLERMSKSK